VIVCEVGSGVAFRSTAAFAAARLDAERHDTGCHSSCEARGSSRFASAAGHTDSLDSETRIPRAPVLLATMHVMYLLYTVYSRYYVVHVPLRVGT